MTYGSWLRKSALTLSATLAVLLVAGCRKEPPPPKPLEALVVGVENDLVSLDPIKSQEPYSLRVIGQVFEGLVTLNARNELEGVLAESWSHNETFDTWTFQIRKGVRFHESDSFGPNRTREVTAQDVVDSFQRIVSKDSYPQFVLADALIGVKEFQEGEAPTVAGLQVTGPMAVEMRLQRPEPAFLHRLTSPWFVVFPREAVALGPDVFGRTTVVGTGPFRLVNRTDNEVTLSRNERYWRPIPGDFTRVTFRVIKNEQLRLTALRNGSIAMMALPVALAPALLEASQTAGSPPRLKAPYSESFVAASFSTFNSHFIGLNCDSLDVHLRRAISFAVDREEILRAIVHGTGVVTAGTVPVGLLGYAPPYAGDIHDLDLARRELAQSKFDPTKDTIELLVHEKDNTEQLGQLIQSQLAKIGIRVSLQKLDYNAVVGRMIQGNTQAFALALEYVFSAPEPILDNIFNSGKIPVPNFWRYRNETVDSGLAELRRTGDRARANALAGSVERQIIDDAPAVFLYQLRYLVVHRADIDGVSFNGHSMPLLWQATRRVERGN